MAERTMNKRGDEIVEAAIVLPVIILTILSMIMLLLFFFACLTAQMEVHQKLVDKALKSHQVMAVSTCESRVGRGIGGAVSLVMEKNVSGRCYLINEAAAIGLGEIFDEDDK
jgi:hypothetical protein